MAEKLTEELLEELLNRPLVDFVNSTEACGQFSAKNLPDSLADLLKKKNLNKKDVIKATDINETHLYQIFSGDRGASRDKILQIAFAMGLNIKDTNHLLNSAGVSELYCKNRRDAIIIYCIKNKCSVFEVNQTLFEFNEDALSES